MHSMIKSWLQWGDVMLIKLIVFSVSARSWRETLLTYLLPRNVHRLFAFYNEPNESADPFVLAFRLLEVCNEQIALAQSERYSRNDYIASNEFEFFSTCES